VDVKTPNQTLQQTAAPLRWLRGIPSFEGRPLLNFSVRHWRLTLSYNVAVIIPPVPATDPEAWAAVDDLRNQNGPRPAVFQELHDQLTAIYPCMCAVSEDEIDNTVWSDGPLINNFGHRVAFLGISYSRVEEVLPFLVERANALGLTVLDWATQIVYRA
jgi:hypothetical protein